jgi:hypothetical protein
MMARLKAVKRGLMMLVVDFDKQLEPGSFEHALCHMVDQSPGPDRARDVRQPR